MSARPYLVLGESDRRLLAQRVAAALEAWRRDWLAGEIVAPVLACESAPHAERWLAVQGTGPRLLLGCTSGWLAQLGDLLAGQPQDTVPRPLELAAPLAKRLGEA